MPKADIERIDLLNGKSTTRPHCWRGHGSLSIARSLGAAGIQVYAINHPQAEVRYSRFCRWIDLPESNSTGTEVWAEYLLGRQSDHLRGAVLLAASDEAIELIVEHRAVAFGKIYA